MAETDALDRVIDYLDKVKALADRREVPAYAQTCPCGASVEVAQGVPAAERRRVWQHFVGLHHECTRPPHHEAGDGDA